VIDLGHSRTRDAVVRELFADPGGEWHVRGLARRTGEAPANVHRELERLARGDWILRRRQGNRVYVRVNADHPLFAEMDALVAKTVGVPRVLAAALAEAPGVEAAVLLSRGDVGATEAAADLPVLVVAGPDTPPEAVEDALRPASQWLQREVRPTVLAAADLRRLAAQRDPGLTKLLAGPREVLVGDEARLRACLGGLWEQDERA